MLADLGPTSPSQSCSCGPPPPLSFVLVAICETVRQYIHDCLLAVWHFIPSYGLLIRCADAGRLQQQLSVYYVHFSFDVRIHDHGRSVYPPALRLYDALTLLKPCRASIRGPRESPPAGPQWPPSSAISTKRKSGAAKKTSIHF